MKISEIAEILKITFNNDIKEKFCNPNSDIIQLLTDSRNYFETEGTLFFAIRTEKGNDGHRYLKDLYERGVRNFIVEKLPDNLSDFNKANFIEVEDTIKALGEIGKIHANNAKEILAITGSRGKTTVKEMIFRLGEPFLNIARSPRSYNSKIGVPLSLWSIPKNTELALIEAGISEEGEMARLSEIIAPDTVLLTNIGEAHSKGFSSDEKKAQEKALLAYGKNVKEVIYNKENKYFEDALKGLSPEVKRVRWSVTDPEAEIYLKISEDKGDGKILLEIYHEGEKECELEVKIKKPFELENLGGSIAYLLNKGITGTEILDSFRNLYSISTRLNVADGVNRCSIIKDNYTSDLTSLIPAIDFMQRRKMPYQTNCLVLSDLKHEIGDEEATYKRVAELIGSAGINRFIGIGKTISQYSDLFPKESKFYKTTEEMLKEISASDFNDEIVLLKGSPEFDFDCIQSLLESRKHETVLEVNLDAMLRNYNYFRSKIPSTTGIIAMVKASGYGAGSYEPAKTLQDAGAAYLAVAALDEGIELRNQGIVMPIMIMNPRAANYKALFKNHLEPVVYSLSMLRLLAGEAAKYQTGEYPVHVKLDTGMHRMGFEKNELEDLLKVLKECNNIKVKTIFSHLATADCLDMDDFTLRQLELFEEMSSRIMEGLNYQVKRHILNSAGILRFPKYHYDYVRLGIGLYGANTLPKEIEQHLSVVSSLKSVIICVREIEKKETVGYGRKGKINRLSRIATIPVGYGDGLNRHFGNGALKVMINGKKAPTIGNICMDATMIDVSDIECKEGDPVEIFGENVNVQTLADTLDTIPYEILTSVSPRVKRIYYRE